MEAFLKLMFPEFANEITSEARWIIINHGNTEHRFTYLDPAVSLLLKLRKRMVG